MQIEGVSDLEDPAAFDEAEVVGVTGSTSSPIEDLRDVARRVLELAGTPGARKDADRLALAALAEAATPAGRTTSLPTAAGPRAAAAGGG